MHRKHPVPNPLLTVHQPADAGSWIIIVEASHDPLLVPRVLQKLAVPEIEVDALEYSREAGVARVQLRVQCTGARAELSVAKLKKLWCVHLVRLEKDPACL